MSGHRERDHLPTSGQICAIARPRSVKAAALLYDRVWVPPARLRLTYVNDTYGDEPIPDEVIFCIVEDARRVYSRTCAAAAHGGGIAMAFQWPLVTRDLAVALRMSNGLAVVPVFDSEHDFTSSYLEGTELLYQATFANLPVADVRGAPWAQIVEFRHDSHAVERYRQLRRWWASGVKVTSLAQATDLVAQKVEDYEWALRKHGILTVTGALTQLLGLRTVVAAASGTVVAALTGENWLGGLTSGLITCGPAAIWIAERRVALNAIPREHSAREVALLAAARSEFEPPLVRITTRD